jgi:hypothetical protein
MPWTDVLLVDDNLEPIAEDVLDGIEHTIGCRLPADYRAFMTTFGIGTYSGLIDFWDPKDIPARTRQLRRIWAEHWWWAEHSDFFGLESADVATQSIALATTIDGDEIVLCPPAQNNLLVLPRHDDVIYKMPSGFADPLVWEGASPENAPETHHIRYFEPVRGRGHVELFTQRTDLTMDSVYRRILPRLSQGAEPVPKIDDDGGILALFKGERAKVSLHMAGGDDRRIGVRIDYRAAQPDAVETVVQDLVSIGFKEIGRYAPTSG